MAGKVTKSADEFPYIEQKITVQMEEPKAATEIKKQIRIKEELLERVEKDKTEIEAFISGIPDSVDRQIFEMSFIDGAKQEDVGYAVGFSRGRISQIISGYLKD